jgi:hypothetical protein
MTESGPDVIVDGGGRCYGDPDVDVGPLWLMLFRMLWTL